MFESAEALSFVAACSPIISRTTLIPASLFVMIESSCKAQATSPPQYYSNGSRTHKYGKTRLCLPIEFYFPGNSFLDQSCIRTSHVRLVLPAQSVDAKLSNSLIQEHFPE